MEEEKQRLAEQAHRLTVQLQAAEGWTTALAEKRFEVIFAMKALGMTVREIGATMGISGPRVVQILHRPPAFQPVPSADAD